MAIIDTFLMLFKADTSNVKKGVDDSEKELKRLERDAKKADAEIANIGKSFRNVAGSFSSLVAGFVSAHAIINGFRESLNYTTEISNLSRELNLNVSTVDAWGQALKRTGGDAQSFKRIIESLTDRYGGTPSQVLSQLPRFADYFSKLSQSQALIRGKQFGFDTPTILLLQQGRREVDALIQRQKELGVVTEKDKEITLKFNNALLDAKQAYNTFYRELSREVTPTFTKVLEYLIKHQDLVKGAFYAIAGGVTVLTGALALANIEIASIVAGLAVFAAAYEDVKRFKAGLPSALGDVRNDLKGRTDKLPTFFQKIIGTKVPDYALPNTHALYRSGIGNSNTSNKNSVHIDNITIQTQATNAQGIGFSLVPELQKQLDQVADHFGSAVVI